MKAMDVTLDVSKLSGWLNADAYCRESKGGHTVRASLGELRVGGGKVAGAGGASSALTKGSIADWGHRHGDGGAHLEHVFHGCDFGCVEAQRLVELRRVLPRVERRAYGAVRGAGLEAGGGGRRRHKQRAVKGSTADWGQGTGWNALRTWSACP